MTLQSHYLKEDQGNLAVEILYLQKTFSKVFESAEKADFTQKEELLNNINHSINTLMALHAKKLEQDRINKREDALKWF